jgi:hypothetical protein
MVVRLFSRGPLMLTTLIKRVSNRFATYLGGKLVAVV